MSDLQKYIDYKTILAVNILVRSHGKFLLNKRSESKKVDPGYYSGVGGKVEPGESFMEAAIREAKEEIGLDLSEKLRPYGILQVPDPNNKAEWVMALFTAEISEQYVVPSTEDGDFHWVDPKDIDKLKILPDGKEFIKILTHNPEAFLLSYCKYAESGDLMGMKTNEF